MKFSSEWESIVTRMGRWIDFKHDYKTLDTGFMESVWWAFKELFDKGQIYRGFSVIFFLYIYIYIYYMQNRTEFKTR
jgi:isoleucyl-tRNA synthetase